MGCWQGRKGEGANTLLQVPPHLVTTTPLPFHSHPVTPRGYYYTKHSVKITIFFFLFFNLFADRIEFHNVRSTLARGLRDLRDVPPGRGNTGHCFNDFNHVDATTMTLDMSDNENRGQVQGIAFGNQLGPGIRVASLPEVGPGGTWCTCAQGAAREPPADVAHLQFRSAIAWKLVWVPTGEFARFVLVDDAGEKLATGMPTGQLPAMRERQYNYEIHKGGRFARAADAYAAAL